MCEQSEPVAEASCQGARAATGSIWAFFLEVLCRTTKVKFSYRPDHFRYRWSLWGVLFHNLFSRSAELASKSAKRAQRNVPMVQKGNEAPVRSPEARELQKSATERAPD